MQSEEKYIPTYILSWFLITIDPVVWLHITYLLTLNYTAMSELDSILKLLNNIWFYIITFVLPLIAIFLLKKPLATCSYQRKKLALKIAYIEVGLYVSIASVVGLLVVLYHVWN